MSLQTYMVVFSSADDANADQVLPSNEEIIDAFKGYLGIPDDNVLVSVYPVDIEAIGYELNACRSCGKDCDEGRLFCDGCAAKIATGEVVEES